MALIEATRYFKTNRYGTRKIMAKYHATANQGYLDEAYRTTANILERTPYAVREGMRV